MRSKWNTQLDSTKLKNSKKEKDKGNQINLPDFKTKDINPYFETKKLAKILCR